MYVPTKEDGLRTPLFIVMVTVAMSLSTKVRHSFVIVLECQTFDLSKHRLNIDKYQIACFILIYIIFSACYGIVQVPTGPWFCRKCESQERAARVVRPPF